MGFEHLPCVETKNLTGFGFLPIRQSRTTTEIEARIEHAALACLPERLRNAVRLAALNDFRNWLIQEAA